MTAPDKAKLARRLRQQRVAGQITIGIAGGSGSGKSTIAASIAQGLPSLDVEVIGLDRFFKPADELPRYYSAHDDAQYADYNRPDSLRVDEMIAACSQPAAADVVLLDGHLALCYEQLRACMDLTCFVDADVEQMLTRRTTRNLAAGYGGGAETIRLYNRECVLPGYEKHILPCRDQADLIIPNFDGASARRDAVIEALCQQVLEATA